MKKMITLLAVVGLVFALAPAAQAQLQGTLHRNYEAANNALNPTEWNDLAEVGTDGDLIFRGTGEPALVTDGTAPGGQAYVFDGANDIAVAPSSSSWITGLSGIDVSFEVWFNPVNLTDEGNLGEVLVSFGGTKGLGIVLDGSIIRFTHGNAGGKHPITATIVAGWSQVVGVVDDTGNVSALYVNGLPVGTPDTTENWKGTGAGSTVGGHVYSGNGVQPNVGSYSNGETDHSAFDGSIAIMRMYDGALTDAQVLNNYNEAAPAGGGSTPGTLIYWK